MTADRIEDQPTTKPGANGKQPGPPTPIGGTPNGMPPDENTKFNCGIGSITAGAIMRKKGSRNTPVKIDYNVIGELVGVAGDTAKQYAHLCEYDPRSLESVLQWVNARRAAKGLPLIEMPSKTHPEVRPDCTVPFLPAPQNGILRYDPITGSYQSEINANTAFWR